MNQARSTVSLRTFAIVGFSVLFCSLTALGEEERERMGGGGDAVRASLTTSLGGVLGEVRSFESIGYVAIKDAGGVERIVSAEDLRFSAEAAETVSPLHGWSPYRYAVERVRSTTHEESPNHRYKVEVIFSPYPSELGDYWDLESVVGAWPRLAALSESAREAERPTFLLAWWNAHEGTWHPNVAHARLFEDHYFAVSMMIDASDLGGRPVLLAWHDGSLVLPAARLETPWEAAFARLRRGIPPTPEDLPQMTNKSPFGPTLLELAATWGDRLWIEAWTQWYPTTSRRPFPDGTPLRQAAKNGHAGLIAPLHEVGMSTRQMDGIGFNAGHFAALYGFTDVIRELIQNGYPVHSTAGDGFYDPISLALDRGYDDLFGLLQSKGARVGQFNRSRRDELLASHAYQGNANAVTYLLSRKANPNAVIEGSPILNFAILGGNPTVVQTLLEAGADPNSEMGNPLWQAVQSNHTEIVERLLAAGAQPRSLTPDGPSPLVLAVLNGNSLLARCLVEAGINPNEALPTEAPLGLIEYAALAGDAEMVSSLFALGAICRFPPELAEEILTVAIAHDLPEIAALAYEACLTEDFAFYGHYDLPWVVDYYHAENVRAWMNALDTLVTRPPPEFAHSNALEIPPRLRQGTIPPYSKELFNRHGELLVRLQIVIEPDGRALFPHLSGDPLPPSLAIALLETIPTWRFEPGKIAGEPVRSRATLPLRFRYTAPKRETFDAEAVTTLPRPLTQKQPVHPPSLHSSRRGGAVVLKVVILADGTTAEIEAVRSTHPLLTFAARNAVKDWTFAPALKDGTPVNMRVLLPMYFNVR